MTRPPKKSESLEIRLPHAAKTAFMERCRREGVSASEVLRADIEARLQAPGRGPQAGWRRWTRAGAAAVAALGVAATALPSLAGSPGRAGFANLDANGDGVLAFAEFSTAQVRIEAGGAKLATAMDPALRGQLLRQVFQGCDADADGRLTFAEFRRAAT